MILDDKQVEIDLVVDSTEIQQLTPGTLYHLRYTYPVIDAIGYLKFNHAYVLVFVQVSLSEYPRHKTKMEHLETVMAPEDQDKTILDFSQSLL